MTAVRRGSFHPLAKDMNNLPARSCNVNAQSGLHRFNAPSDKLIPKLPFSLPLRVHLRQSSITTSHRSLRLATSTLSDNMALHTDARTELLASLAHRPGHLTNNMIRISRPATTSSLRKKPESRCRAGYSGQAAAGNPAHDPLTAGLPLAFGYHANLFPWYLSGRVSPSTALL